MKRQEYTEGRSFLNEDYTEKQPAKGEYENCTFTGCNFSNTDLSGYSFPECEFRDCDFSMAKLKDTVFRDVKFKNCKLLGLHFGDCNPFLLSFEFKGCLLNFSSFYRLKIKDTRFEDCKLEETEFVETDLTGAVFKNCDLRGAVFENAVLEQADFRTAFNFSIDPEMNRMNKAKFSAHNLGGLLNKYNIFIE